MFSRCCYSEVQVKLIITIWCGPALTLASRCHLHGTQQQSAPRSLTDGGFCNKVRCSADEEILYKASQTVISKEFQGWNELIGVSITCIDCWLNWLHVDLNDYQHTFENKSLT